MKSRNLFPILFCMSIMFLITSCENAELQKGSGIIELRSDCIEECEDCPDNDCCCSITLTDGFTTNFILCGTTDPCYGTSTCGPVEAGTCTISGNELPITLSLFQTELFCVATNTPFYVYTTSNVTARITCQVGQGTPQTVTAVFNSPTNEKNYYTVNGDCVIASCL